MNEYTENEIIAVLNNPNDFPPKKVAEMLIAGCFAIEDLKRNGLASNQDNLLEKALLKHKEKDNYEMVTVSAKVPVKDSEGKRVKEVVDGKKVTKYETVEKEIKKDLPSRLHARRQMLKTLVPVVENNGKKRDTKEVDLVAKLFDEIAPKYADRKGGYTRIIKIGQRKGDGALEVVLELV